MLSTPFLVVAVCAALYYAISGVLEAKRDPREPPTLPQRIPFIGHVIGMIQKKAKYYVRLR